MTNSPPSIREAAQRLREGGLVAFPTETVYGLGADATSPDSVARIYAAKGRPRFNPLISHVADVAQAHLQARFTTPAERLAAKFWPGPLTLVLPRIANGTVCDLACAGLGTIALRVPSHPIALALIEAAGRPIAAPSANRSGRISPTTAADVRADLGDDVDMVVDGGPCTVGLESTIVACADRHVTLLRPGALSVDEIEAVIGSAVATAVSGIRAPGMLASHYAPAARLRLNATTISDGEVGLDYGGQMAGTAAFDLSPTRSLGEAAARLYGALRQLDRMGASTIAVACVPDEGIGAAINDRLQRAAAPRPA